MIGAIIGGALALGGAIASGVAGAKSKRRQDKIISDQERDNEQWYKKNYNEVSTERADAVSALTQMRELMKERRKNAVGVSAVMGGSNEALAMEKQAQTNVIGDTVANIALAGEARKEAVERQYLAMKNDIQNGRLMTEKEKMQNIANASQSMVNSGVNMIGSSGLLKSKNK